MDSEVTLPSKLILVAGPSGAGKTTFVESLLAGALPDALLRMFPDGLQEWARLEGNVFVKRGRPVAAFLSQLAPGRGVIVHYDTLLIHRYGLERYQDDPVFSLFAQADAVVVVNLVPPPQLLRAQFAVRRLRKSDGKGWARRMWGRVHKLARPLRLRMRGRSAPDTGEIYGVMNDLQHVYSQWDQFVRSLVRNVPNARMAYVTPRAGAGERTFDLVDVG